MEPATWNPGLGSSCSMEPEPADGAGPRGTETELELELSGNAGQAREPEPEPESQPEPLVKQEAEAEAGLGYKECVLCASRTDAVYDIYYETTGGAVALCTYICRVANLNLDLVTYSKYACGACFDLINVLERAELEYLKRRERLLEIIARNPLLEGCGAFVELDARAGPLDYVKLERCKSERRVSSEDDAPLASVRPQRTRRHAKPVPCKGMPSTPDLRNDVSDEDLCWKHEKNEANDATRKSSTRKKSKIHKKSRKKLAKMMAKIKDEIEHKNPADILLVELTEPNEDNDLNSSNKESNEDVKPKSNKIKGSKGSKVKKNLKSKKGPKVKKGPTVCPECNKTFTKSCYLQYHLAQIHKKGTHPFICEVCGRGFKSMRLCEVHVLMHQGISDWKCVPCNKLFPNKFAFERHDKIHNGKPKYQCDLCGKSFIHKSSFRMHNFMHAGIKRAHCDVCGLSLLSNSHLARHKRIHSGEKRFECEFCGKKFSEKYNLQSHMKTHLKVKDTNITESTSKRKRLFRCEMCEDKFDRLFKLELHLVHEHKQVLKKGPPKPRNTWKKLRRAQEAAASMVNAIATAMTATAMKRDQQLSSTGSEQTVDVKPSVSSLNEKMKETSSSSSRPFKNSPERSMSPATYMSPPQAEAGAIVNYQNQIRSSGGPWPASFYNLGAGYVPRMPDYSQH